MNHLIDLNLSNNSIKDLKPLYNEENFKNLKYLNLSNNKAVDLLGIKIPNLQRLILNHNFIENLSGFEGHPKLQKLELVGNKINSTVQFISMP